MILTAYFVVAVSYKHSALKLKNNFIYIKIGKYLTILKMRLNKSILWQNSHKNSYKYTYIRVINNARIENGL
jgi:hypothetical protein